MVHKSQLSLLLLLFGCALGAFGQTLENVKASFDGEKMEITYDLGFTDANQKFKVALYSSHDNYTTPLSLTTGDVGESVHSGRANRVLWYAKNTLPSDFDADVTIKIKVSKAIAAGSAVKLSLKPLERNVYKKGQSVEVRWLGGGPDEKVNIELYKGGVMQQKVAEKIANSQHYSWVIPKGGVVGKEYILRISNSSNATELSNSQFFTVKPKVPLLLKVLPIAVAGGVIAIVSGGKEKKPSGNENLPEPLKPN